MKQTVNRVFSLVLGVAATLVAAKASAVSPYGLWNFNQGDLSATVGSGLTYSDGVGGPTQSATRFGTTTALGIGDIAGTSAKIMQFGTNTSGMGYYMTAPATINGGGSLLNSFSVLFDLYFGSESDGKVRPLILTDDGTFTGRKTLISIGAGNGIGSSSMQGTVTANSWHRIGLVFDGDKNVLHKYIDGLSVGDETMAGVDGGYALVPGNSVLLLGDSATDVTAGGYVNSIQFWDVSLSAGQIRALGVASADGIPQVIPPIPSYIESRSPGVSQTGVDLLPTISVALKWGDTTISSSSISLYMDDAKLAPSVTQDTDGYTISTTIASRLGSTTIHTVKLVYTDNKLGTQTISWDFTVESYQDITLPTPIYLENFDEVELGGLPVGWSQTNKTDSINPGIDYSDPKSDAYLSFLVIDYDTLSSTFDHRRLELPPIYLNGQLVDSLVSNSALWTDSDNRSGTQVSAAFSSDYNLAGKSNIFVAWKSSYEQNQDNIASVEYSIDQGVTWLPVIYYLDDKNQANDVVRTNGVVDVMATLGTARSGQPFDLAYSNFIGATVTASLTPYIAGRIDDDRLNGKRIEVVRLPKADGQSHVRFRFGYAGTGSWYFGVDDFGLYSINTPVITTQPASQSVDEGASVSFNVVASSSTPLSYQWVFKNKSIVGATNDTYTIAATTLTNAGAYQVIVSNKDGSVTSSTASLTIVSNAVIVTPPQNQFLSPSNTISLTGAARGGLPLNYFWAFNGSILAGQTNSSLVINNAQTTNSGLYALVVTNKYGAVTSSVAVVTVFSGKITNDLVAHLKFDGDYIDSSAYGSDAQAVGSPVFETGLLGQAIHLVSAKDNSTNNYVTLGYPDALKFKTNNFSFAFWAKVYSQSDDKPFICNKDWNSGGNPGWVLALQSGGLKWNINDTAKLGRRDSTAAGSQLLDKSWHQVTVTFDRTGSGRVYVDAVLVDTTSVAPNAGVAVGSFDTDELGLSINLGQDGTGNYTDGTQASIDCLMDDVGIWSRLLTPQEIASIYVQGLSGKDLTTASGANVMLPPGVGTSPVSQAVSVGSPVSFSVIPTGTGPFTYAWYKNGSLINSATSSNLAFNATTADAGSYVVLVSNLGGSVTSSPAALLVYNGVITNGLVAHLKFDGDYADASGRGNNAKAVGAPSFVTGIVGQAMKFTSLKDGSSFNYATLGAPADLQFGTNDFSVSFWVNYTTSSDDPAFISNKDWNSSSNPGWGVFTQNGGNFKVNAAGPNGGGDKFNTSFSSIVRDGKWHQITVSYWRNNVVLTYVDGVLIATSPFKTAGTLDTALAINIGQDGTGTYTDGNAAQIVDAAIDDVGIWRRVLTADEVAQIHTAGLAGKDLTLQAPVTPIELSYTYDAHSVKFTWTAKSTLRLQQATKLGANADWTDVPNTLGAASATVNPTNAAAFYRLAE